MNFNHQLRFHEPQYSQSSNSIKTRLICIWTYNDNPLNPSSDRKIRSPTPQQDIKAYYGKQTVPADGVEIDERRNGDDVTGHPMDYSQPLRLDPSLLRRLTPRGNRIRCFIDSTVRGVNCGVWGGGSVQDWMDAGRAVGAIDEGCWRRQYWSL